MSCYDDGVGVNESIRFTATAGTTYYISSGTCCGGDVGQVGPGGNLVFSIEPFTAFHVEVTVDPVAELGHLPGTAIITGTVTCSSEGYYEIDGQLRQRQRSGRDYRELLHDGCVFCHPQHVDGYCGHVRSAVVYEEDRIRRHGIRLRLHFMRSR